MELATTGNTARERKRPNAGHAADALRARLNSAFGETLRSARASPNRREADIGLVLWEPLDPVLVAFFALYEADWRGWRAIRAPADACPASCFRQALTRW